MSKATLIYDGKCPICSGAADWIHERVGDDIELLPCQENARAERFPDISEQQCMESMWLVTQDGTRYAGDRALPSILRMMPRYKWLAWICELPLIRHIAPHVYRLIAKNRYHLSVLYEKEGHYKEPDSCGPEGKCDVEPK